MSVHRLAVQARLLARNVDNGEVVAHRVASATRRLDRAVGLLTRRGLEPGEALWIVPCRGVHTCGMRFAIDIVALDRSGTVVDLVGDLRPWRIRLPRNGTSSVLELAAGSLAKLKTKLGHRIALEIDHEGHESELRTQNSEGRRPEQIAFLLSSAFCLLSFSAVTQKSLG